MCEVGLIISSDATQIKKSCKQYANVLESCGDLELFDMSLLLFQKLLASTKALNQRIQRFNELLQTDVSSGIDEDCDEPPQLPSVAVAAAGGDYLATTTEIVAGTESVTSTETFSKAAAGTEKGNRKACEGREKQNDERGYVICPFCKCINNIREGRKKCELCATTLIKREPGRYLNLILL